MDEPMGAASRRSKVALVALVAAVVLAAGCKEPTAGPEPPGTESITKELASVQADASRIAPQLETWFRTHGYAKSLDEATKAMAAAGLATTPPNIVGEYRYDEASVEFVLCIETPSGTHASFDTHPMTLRTSGASGGCGDD